MKLNSCFKYLVFIIVLVAHATCAHDDREVDDEREFSYNDDSEIGPSHWGEIRSEWKWCNTGTTQSPIDLMHQRVEMVSHFGTIDRAYKPSNATLINRGHDMMIRWPGGAGTVQINGTTFQLEQCHWHSPSEHTINGRRFDMEVHLVHRSNDNRTAIIGILYQIGRPDSFLSMMKRDLKTVADAREKIVGIIDPELIKFDSRQYYRYIGSLTTPPCTQNIIWTIVRKVSTVTREQIDLIRDAVHDDSEANARPVQAIHERTVKLYRPRDGEN